MTLHRRLFLAAGLAAAAGPALAEPPRTVPAKKIFPYLDLYLSIPPAERTRFTLGYYLKRDGKPFSGAGFVLLGPGGSRTPLPLAANGRFTRTPSLADLKADAQVEVPPAGQGRFQLSMEMEPLIAMAQTMNAGDFAAAIDQCAAAIRKKAGLLGFAVPKISQVAFVGVPAGSAVLPGGRAAALPLVKAMPAYSPSALPGATELRFAKAPARAVLA